MTTFTDQLGREWRIELDGLILADVRKETDIDLADMTAEGLSRIAFNSIDLVQVVTVLCRDQIKEERIETRGCKGSFADGLKGEALDRAEAAVMEAAADFFPPEQWSRLQSRLESCKTLAGAMTQWAIARRAAAQVGPDFVEGMMSELSTDGETSTGEPSASTSENTPSMPASDTPASAVSAPEA